MRWPTPLLFLFCASISSAAEPPPAVATLTYSGDQSAIEALDAEINAAGSDAAKLGALETKLLALIRRPDATYAARQACAQRLGLILAQGSARTTAEGYKPLPTMLAEDRDSDLARLALEPVPGAVIDGIFVTALGKTTGRTRLGIIDSLARRRATSAVSALTKLLKDSDPATAGAAARALGQIANPPAVAALHAFPEPSPSPVAAAKLAAASRMPPAAALTMLRELEKNARDPVHRTTAFRVSLDIERGTAATRIADALNGNDWTLKQVALEAIAGSGAPNLASTLIAKMESWDPPTQAAVIAALGRRNEASAVASITKAVGHADSEVRASAITALGLLPGSRETAAVLAKVAAGDKAEEARLARQSLARLAGKDVNAAVFAGAERGDAELRAVYLEQLALRNQVEGIPLLLKCRQDPDASVRLAAVGALGDLAPFTQQKELLDWTIAATDDAEQSRALRSLVNVTLRNPAIAERGRAIYDAIEKATPEVAVRLLPALSRLGGKASADCAARLALRDNAPIAEGAADALSKWNDRTALPALANVAEKAPLPAVKTAAVDGALRTFERTRDSWSADSSELVSRLLAATKDDARRKRLFALFTRASDARAQSLAEQLSSDSALGSAARDTIDIIKANRAGPASVRVSGSEAQRGNILDGKTSTRWSVPAEGAEWVEVDFKVTRPIHRVTLDQTGRTAEFPEHYEVYVTEDPKQPGAALASGTGQRNKTVIDLPPATRGRYLIVRNTAERKDAPWAICELWVD